MSATNLIQMSRVDETCFYLQTSRANTKFLSFHFSICQEYFMYAWRHTLAFFGNFRSEIQTWESTSFGAKLGKKRGNQQVFTK